MLKMLGSRFHQVAKLPYKGQAENTELSETSEMSEKISEMSEKISEKALRCWRKFRPKIGVMPPGMQGRNIICFVSDKQIVCCFLFCL